MREIKFRGKSDSGWHYGLLTFMFNSYAISYVEDENTVDLIDKETVGQYTGLKDANGVEIFEGDIVKSQNGTGGLIYKHIVEWNNFYKRFEPMGTDESCFNRESCEVIGNIYENKELLEEK